MPRRLLPLDHYPQEVDAGCLAACTQMILASLDITVSQAKLNRLFDLTAGGVPLSRLKRVTRYGVQVTIHRYAVADDLRQAIDQKITPIVFVYTGQLSYWQIDTQHALVVQGYDGPYLLLNDPAFTESPKKVEEAEFMLAWDEFYNTYAQITK